MEDDSRVPTLSRIGSDS